MEIGERIAKGLKEILESKEISLLKKLDPETKTVKMTLSFYVIEVKDGQVFIETGTKSKPSGIATSGASDVMIFNPNDKSYLVLTIKDLQKCIKQHKPERKLSEDYKAMGFIMDEKDAWKYFADDAYLNTLPF